MINGFIKRCEDICAPIFARIEEIEYKNQRKVLDSFQRNEISARHFAPTTGYGYDDIGRDTLSKMYAEVLGCEAAIVRPQIVSGTHALALCLQGVLRPGDVMLSAAGKPYDTLEEVIGLTGEHNGSLREFGVGYRQVELTAEGEIDIPTTIDALGDRVKLVLIQRSRGYAWRPSLSMQQIRAAIEAVHQKNPDICVMIDNCYGEFADEIEPGNIGADLMAGSLIKNVGGGIAPTGGYIAGKARFVEQAAYRLTSPGIGAEVGSYACGYQPFYQGLFMAPHTVAQALKTAALTAKAFKTLGFEVHPEYDAARSDIIQAVRFEDPDKVIAFCRAIQRHSPIDSQVAPEPWDMPGYQHPVIMAAGTFVAGASIELSADAPIRPPYIAYMQGALTYAHGKLALEGVLESMVKSGFIDARRLNS